MAKTDVQIWQNENTDQLCTVFMEGLNFLNSYWQFFGVNVWMVECDAASLTLDLIYLTNVTIENCTFGNWTFWQVQNVIIKNTRSFKMNYFQTYLNFYNSSGLMKNIAMNDLNFTNMFEGLWVQSNSFLRITRSNFANNTVFQGLIKVLDSSTLEMSDCNLQSNQAIDYAGAIFTDKSFIYITNTSFEDNKAIQAGGALALQEGSFLHMKRCSFSNNQVKFWSNARLIKDGFGEAIFLSNSTANGFNIYFTGNKANYSGGLYIKLYSKVKMQDTYFSDNRAVIGSASFIFNLCKYSCKNCSLYQNENIDAINGTDSAAVNLYLNSTLNVSDFKCENHRGYYVGCIYADYNSTVFINNATFNMNTGCAIVVANNSLLVTVSSFFNNNTQPNKFAGAAIISKKSTLEISHCRFNNHLNTAVSLVLGTTASIANCIFEGNSSPMGGALFIIYSWDVSVSHTTFLENSAKNFGGAVNVVNESLLVISNCSFMRNVALNKSIEEGDRGIDGRRGGGGGISISGSVVKLYQSQFYNNFAGDDGGSILINNKSSLFIHDTVFKNNTVIFYGSAISSSAKCFVTIYNSYFMNNSALDKTTDKGECLIFGSSSIVVISNVHFIENKAGDGVGIVVSDFTEITILNSSFVIKGGSVITIMDSISLHMDHCEFLNSTTGLTVLSSHVVYITNTVFSYNTGGVLKIVTSNNISFHNCSFSDNFSFKGAVLSAENSIVQFIGCNFLKNNAKSDGGVYLISGYLFLKNCMVINNSAGGDGGFGHFVLNSKINIATSVFRENSADLSGGVLWVRNSTVNVWNSSFVENKAMSGGVIYEQYFSLFNFSQAIFHGNSAKTGGGGVFMGMWNTQGFFHTSKMYHNYADFCVVCTVQTTCTIEISFSQVYQNSANIDSGAICAINGS